jgi:hypothetical protein
MAPRGVEIRLTSGAVAELAELGPRRRGMLTIELGSRAQGALDPGLLVVWTATDVAACEVLTGDEPAGGPALLLVYAIRSRRALAAALFGPELDQRFTGLAIRRVLHHGLSNVGAS